MSISLDRQIKLVDSFKDAIRNLINNGRRFHWHHTFITKAFRDLWDLPNWKRLPQHQQSYLRGYFDSLYDQIWRNDVAFSYEYCGRRYMIKTDEWDNLGVDYKILDTNTGAYVWKDDINKFFTDPPNEVLFGSSV